MADLDATTELFRLLGDPTRVRLLCLLAADELSVAELTEVTQLAQSRVSTHLGLLRDAGLIRSRRAGSSTFHALADGAMPAEAAAIWAVVAQQTTDARLGQDRERAARVIAARDGDGTWADQVAGRMATHYSPGRTWESALRGLVGLCRLGRVLDVASGDGALAELLAPHAVDVVCLDRSARVVATGQRRLAHLGNLRFVEGDMHALPFEPRSFDAALLLSALDYADSPQVVIREVGRVVAPGGAVVGVALAKHEHGAVVGPYDHVQSGFEADDLRGWLDEAGFDVTQCAVTVKESRPPQFEVITFHGRRR